MAGEVSVGECVLLGEEPAGGSMAFARPKSSTFTVPSVRTLMFAGFEIAMDDSLLVRRFQRLRDLLRDGQRLIERNRPASDPLRQIVALDEFHHERGEAHAFFEPVDGGDVGMIQGREHFGFALKPRQPVVIRRE